MVFPLTFITNFIANHLLKSFLGGGSAHLLKCASTESAQKSGKNSYNSSYPFFSFHGLSSFNYSASKIAE